MSNRNSRQLFLGDRSEQMLGNTVVAVLGASGGGSPIAQQLAHVGFGTVHVIDPASAEEHHTHRLIGVSRAAVTHRWKKVRVVERLMRRVFPEGNVITHPCKWQEVHEVLRTCHLVFSCLDGYLARDELERYVRRYQVPLIDIGMDVSQHESGYAIHGQAILSMPGSHCMRCFGFIRDELLAKEARRYGNAGVNPQVVWPNGALASAAVGMAMSLLLPWHQQLEVAPYLVYDGNRMQVMPSPRLEHVVEIPCSHYV